MYIWVLWNLNKGETIVRGKVIPTRYYITFGNKRDGWAKSCLYSGELFDATHNELIASAIAIDNLLFLSNILGYDMVLCCWIVLLLICARIDIS